MGEGWGKCLRTLAHYNGSSTPSGLYAGATVLRWSGLNLQALGKRPVCKQFFVPAVLSGPVK